MLVASTQTGQFIMPIGTMWLSPIRSRRMERHREGYLLRPMKSKYSTPAVARLQGTPPPPGRPLANRPAACSVTGGPKYQTPRAKGTAPSPMARGPLRRRTDTQTRCVPPLRSMIDESCVTFPDARMLWRATAVYAVSSIRVPSPAAAFAARARTHEHGCGRTRTPCASQLS
jgi:hypothetical protein